MRADYYDRIAPAGILDPEDMLARKYRGMNPEFVKKIWAKRKGVGPHIAWTPERKSEVLQLIEDGKTYGQIALKMGVSRSSISGVIHATPFLKKAMDARRDLHSLQER